MLTSKQNSYLKKLAHNLTPTCQIGKDGLTENIITDIYNYLNKHELMKVSVLQNCIYETEEIAENFKDTDIELVQVIGRTIVLYQKSKNAKYPIVLPK